METKNQLEIDQAKSLIGVGLLKAQMSSAWVAATLGIIDCLDGVKEVGRFIKLIEQFNEDNEQYLTSNTKFSIDELNVCSHFIQPMRAYYFYRYGKDVFDSMECTKIDYNAELFIPTHLSSVIEIITIFENIVAFSYAAHFPETVISQIHECIKPIINIRSSIVMGLANRLNVPQAIDIGSTQKTLQNIVEMAKARQ